MRLSGYSSILFVSLIFLFLLREGLPALGGQIPLSSLFGQRWYPIEEYFSLLPLLLRLGPGDRRRPDHRHSGRRGDQRLHLRSGPALGQPSGQTADRNPGRAALGRAGFPRHPGRRAIAAARVRPADRLDARSSGAVLLALIATPTIVSITEDALNTVPRAYREAALAVGATRWQIIWGVTVPAARSGVLTAVMLGVGRSIGETMAVMMVTGNAPVLPHGLDLFFTPGAHHDRDDRL